MSGTDMQRSARYTCLTSPTPSSLASAARALLPTDLDALTLAERSMRIAAGMCVYTNTRFAVDAIPALSDAEAAHYTHAAMRARDLT